MAHVSEELNGEKTTSEVHFQFKDRMLKSDGKIFKDGKLIEAVIWGRGQEHTFFYEPANEQASIAPPDFDHVHNGRLGKDFNPATFRTVADGLDIARSLTHLLKMESKYKKGTELQVNLDDKGILQVRQTYDLETERGDITYRFDTTKGYNLIGYRLNHTSKREDAHKTVRTYQANWKKQGTGWYISDFTFDYKSIRKDRQTGESSPWHFHTEGRIDEFVPDCDIDDSTFTLASVDLPYGTLVIDDIKGLQYRVGVP